MSNYISQFYTWNTGDTLTKARLNGNVSNLIDGLNGGDKWINVGNIEVNDIQIVNSSREIVNVASLTVDNLIINGNDISSSVGDVTITPVAGSDVVIDGHFEFDGPLLTAITDNNTTITAYAGKNVTIESVTLDGGVVAGVTSLAVGNLVVNGNDISSSTGDVTITPVTGSDVVIDGHFEFDGPLLTALTDNNTTITAYAGKNVTIESVTLDGGVVAGVTSLAVGNMTLNNITIRSTTGEFMYLGGSIGDDLWGIGASGGTPVLSPLKGSDANIVAQAGYKMIVEGVEFDGGLVTGATSFSTGNVAVKWKKIDIGDWNMDSTASVTVAHGLTYTNIIAVNVIIKNDAGTANYSELDSTPSLLDATNITLSRLTGGTFDGVDFDSTVYNRGTIFFTYI